MTTSPDTGGHAVVVTVYRDNPFLPACLRSLRAQTLASEIIITTPTPSVFVAASAAEVGAKVVVKPEDGGIADNWNFALNASDARYVTLAHQDDLYYPRFLERSLALFEKHDGAVLSFTGYEEVDDHGLPVSTKISRVKHLIEAVTLGSRTLVGGARLRAFLSFGNPLPCSSVTFDRHRLGAFCFSGDFASNLDWDAWLRLLQRGESFARTPEKLVGRRYNESMTTTALLRDGRRAAEDLRMFRRLWPTPVGETLALFYRAGY